MVCIINNSIAFPADIGRKPASPARGSRQCLHAGERYTPASEMDLVYLNMAASVRSVMSWSRTIQSTWIAVVCIFIIAQHNRFMTWHCIALYICTKVVSITDSGRLWLQRCSTVAPGHGLQCPEMNTDSFLTRSENSLFAPRCTEHNPEISTCYNFIEHCKQIEKKYMTHINISFTNIDETKPDLWVQSTRWQL